MLLCGIPIEILMKVFEAKERQGKAIREMPPYLVRVLNSSAGEGLGSEGRREGGIIDVDSLGTLNDR